MGLSSFSSFEGPDIGAFVVCAAIGIFAGTFAPKDSAASLYITVMVAYHAFLAWLIFLSGTSFSDGDAQKKAAISLPIGQTLLTHAACLAVILGAAATAAHKLLQPNAADDPMVQMEHQQIAYRAVQAICGSMAGLAIFERRWLFSSEDGVKPAKPLETPSVPLDVVATADDMREWQHYLAQQKPGTRKPGSSLKAEYEQWLRARRTAATSTRTDA